MNGALPILNGARVDGRKMCETMELLKFETHWEHNATVAVTIRLIRETARWQYLPNYKRLVFIFSGHGSYIRQNTTSTRKMGSRSTFMMTS